MTTVQNVFDYAMSLIGQRLENGTVDPTSTAVYVKNTPYLLTMLQDELIRSSEYYKTHTIEKSEKTENEGHYAKYTMPGDFYNAYQMVSIENKGNYELANDYRWEGQKDLYIPDTFIGTIRVVYYPIPIPLATMKDELVLDDITCRTTLVNGLASRLLTNENKVLANYFGDIYNELKSTPKPKNPTDATSIKDVYNLWT